MAIYPFERFTERTKRVLILAQEEAQRAHHSYIGTEHLLLGLMRESDGLAAKVLQNLELEIDAVRKHIEAVMGGNTERIVIQQIIPTSRVKKVLEMSFEEAGRMGHNYVGTEHILLGLLVEGEGIAAHVLNDLGAGLDSVRREVERLLGETGSSKKVGSLGQDRPIIVRTGELPLSPRAVLVGRLARFLAGARKAAAVEVEHIREVLGDPGVVSLLDLRERQVAAAEAKQTAVTAQNHEQAAFLRDVEEQLQEEFTNAEGAWVKKVHGRPAKRGPRRTK